MLTVDQAREAVLSRARRLSGRAVSLIEADGCVLAEDVAADLDVPPFDKALVDGYAVRAADSAAGVERFEVIAEITAGQVPDRPLGGREAAFVMTGAPLPDGADAVVMHEVVERDGTQVVIEARHVAPGRNRLARGREMRRGDVVVRAGTCLHPTHLGVLATVGRDPVVVTPRPTVAILPTGDELVNPGEVPGPGQIRNSNGVMLAALARQAGAEAHGLPIVADVPEVLRERLAEGLRADVLLVTGGVSAGKLDLVPGALESLGVERIFHKIRLKPGKPLWFGVGPARGDRPGALVFGLPGNPVSGLVGFLLLVRPALAVLAGRERACHEAIEARLGRPYCHRGDRPTYHPATLRRSEAGPPTVEPLDWAGSADLRTVARAHGFAVFPAGDREHAAGEIVSFLPLG